MDLEVAYQYAGWSVVIDDRAPVDMYVTDPERQTLRMTEPTWHAMSQNGIIEDIIDHLPKAGLTDACSPQYDESMRDFEHSEDRIRALTVLADRVVSWSAEGAAPSELIAHVGQANECLATLREELDMAGIKLALAAQAVAAQSVDV